jgi:hypothetical protein
MPHNKKKAQQPLLSSSRVSVGYFEKFKDFVPDPTTGLLENFSRLALHEGWNEDSRAYQRKRNSCLEQEFKALYGTDDTILEGWQSLCKEVGIKDCPLSITQCKKVNISEE